MAPSGQAHVLRKPKERPAALCVRQRASGAAVREWRSSLHERHAEQCGSDAAATDLLEKTVGNRSGLLGVPQLVARKRDDSCQADVLRNPGGSVTGGHMTLPAGMCSLCLHGIAWGTKFPLVWPSAVKP